MTLAIVSRARRRKRKAKDPADAPRLDADAIVTAALNLIDVGGIDNFSMRNLGKALGVYPTAIYWHVPDRNAIIGEVIKRVHQGIVPDVDAPWQDWFKALFRNYREAIRRHPNIAPVIGAQLISNVCLDCDMIEAILGRLVDAGFARDRVPAAFNAVMATMVGFTTQEFGLVPTVDVSGWRDLMEEKIRTIEPSVHPLLAANLPDLANKAFMIRWQNGVDAPLDAGFEFFIDAVVRGLSSMRHPEPV